MGDQAALNLIHTTKVRAAEDHVFCEIDQEAVILSLKDGIYYGLNPVGAVVWSMAQNGATYGEMISRLLEEYNVEREQCERDVTALLGQLASKGMVQIEQ